MWERAKEPSTWAGVGIVSEGVAQATGFTMFHGAGIIFGALAMAMRG